MNVHLRFGVSESEWVRAKVEESRSDPVGLWQIIAAGKLGFGLVDAELETFVVNHIFALLESGAQPVTFDKSQKSGWRLMSELAQNDRKMLARSIVQEWRVAEVVASPGGIWFGAESSL